MSIEAYCQYNAAKLSRRGSVQANTTADAHIVASQLMEGKAGLLGSRFLITIRKPLHKGAGTLPFNQVE